MPRKPQTDFSIDLSPTTEPSDGERSPPASPVPQPNAKKPYNFSEARRQALERGRQKRAANLKRQREEREAQKAQLKAKKEQALASKIQQELEEEVQPDSQAVKEQVKRSAKRKVKRHSAPIPPRHDPPPSSESDYDSDQGARCMKRSTANTSAYGTGTR